MPGSGPAQGQETGKSILVGIIVCLWGLNLAYPLNHLQGLRMALFGYQVPMYYFLTALPAAAAAIVAIALKLRWTRWQLAWLGLPLICLPGITRSADVAWSIRQWFSWMIRGPIPGAVLLLYASTYKTHLAIIRFLYPIIVAASILGLMEVYLNRNLLWDSPPSNYSLVKPTAQPDNPFYRPEFQIKLSAVPRGTQGNRIPFAACLAAFLPISLWLLKHQNSKRPAYLAGAALLGSIVLLADARSAWLATIAMLAFLTSVRFLKGRRQVAAVVGAALFCVAAFLLWPRTHELLLSRLTSFRASDNDVRYRLDVLAHLSALAQNWAVGIGFGQFPNAARQYYPKDMPWFGTPDDQYLRWAIENGLPSLAALAAFFIGLVRAGWREVRLMGEGPEADMYKALLAGCFGLAVTFLFFDGFYWGACNMTFWCLLGLFSTALGHKDDAAASRTML